MADMSLTERETKQELLATAKELLRRGLVEGTSGNLSARLPGGNVVMTPSSVGYDCMTLDDLVVCSPDGVVVDGDRTPTTEKALHLACLERRPDIHAVIHSHALFCSMFAVAGQPIPCVIEELDLYVGGEIPVAGYRPTGSDELAEEVSRRLGDRAAVLMANHGLLAVARSAIDALKVTSLVERSAHIVWGARVLGGPVPLPSAQAPGDATRKR